jgi:ribosomal protein L37AE/L43A
MDFPYGASDEEDERAARSFDCPSCGAEQRHSDDFCHDCGHAFAWMASELGGDELGEEPRGEQCPMCTSGEVQHLPDGIRQCDACGYTARDWSTA